MARVHARKRIQTAAATQPISPSHSALGFHCTKSLSVPCQFLPAEFCSSQSAHRRRRSPIQEKRWRYRPHQHRGWPKSGSHHRNQHWLMTSCARRSISGLPRCTESKSSAALLAPAAIELAAPPPMPMRMPGKRPIAPRACQLEIQFCASSGRLSCRCRAIMMGLW